MRVKEWEPQENSGDSVELMGILYVIARSKWLQTKTVIKSNDFFDCVTDWELSILFGILVLIGAVIL